MKRHEALAPLSRDHHEALILSQLLKKDSPAYKGLPVTVEGKVNYAVGFFEKNLKDHFEKEEKVFVLVKTMHPEEIGVLVSELTEEHHTLARLFSEIGSKENPMETMNRLGELLNNHIRKEERNLFPLLQKHCTEEMFEKISQLTI
jgi:iron-sulfur cluster repair protein YtfE (RIC family)